MNDRSIEKYHKWRKWLFNQWIDPPPFDGRLIELDENRVIIFDNKPIGDVKFLAIADFSNAINEDDYRDQNKLKPFTQLTYFDPDGFTDEQLLNKVKNLWAFL